MLGLGDRAPNIELFRPDGMSVAVEEYWTKYPIVLDFYAHFGSIFDKDHLSRMRAAAAKFRGAGAHVICVFMGSPTQVSEYGAARAIPFTCLADPDRSAYRQFGLEPDLRGLLSPRVFLKGALLFRRGITLGLPHPGQDIRQRAGTFVIERGGRIRWAWYRSDPSQTPPIDLILAALGAS